LNKKLFLRVKSSGKKWLGSSVGKSTGFITLRSAVQIRPSPPLKKLSSQKHFSPRKTKYTMKQIQHFYDGTLFFAIPKTIPIKRAQVALLQ
jgi:hypothetical protein